MNLFRRRRNHLSATLFSWSSYAVYLTSNEFKETAELPERMFGGGEILKPVNDRFNEL